MSKDEKRDATLSLRAPGRIKRILNRISDRDGIPVSDIVVPFLDGVIEAYEKRRASK